MCENNKPKQTSELNESTKKCKVANIFNQMMLHKLSLNFL